MRTQKMPADVSVILCTYNRARHVGGAIESIRNQTHTNWELIIVDDGSTDTTPKILKSYTQKDKRIRCHRHDNRGIAQSRNVGIELARTDYIMFHDDDDLSHPQRIATCLTAMRKAEAADIVTAAACDFHAQTGDMLEVYHQPHMSLYKKAIVQNVGGFRPFFLASEDLDLQFRLTLSGANRMQIPDILYLIRRNDCNRHQHLHLSKDVAFYEFAARFSVWCRENGSPDPIDTAKAKTDVIAHLLSLPIDKQRHLIRSRYLKSYKMLGGEYAAAKDDAAIRQNWQSAYTTLQDLGYTHQERNSEMRKMYMSVRMARIRNWLRHIKRRRYSLADYKVESYLTQKDAAKYYS